MKLVSQISIELYEKRVKRIKLLYIFLFNRIFMLLFFHSAHSQLRKSKRTPKYCMPEEMIFRIFYTKWTTHFIKFYSNFYTKDILNNIKIYSIYMPIYSHEQQQIEEDWYKAVYYKAAEHYTQIKLKSFCNLFWIVSSRDI